MTGADLTGRVTCEARIENEFDAASARRGERPWSAVRVVRFTAAVIDPRGPALGLPARMMRDLGRDDLLPVGGPGAGRYGPVRLWIGDRDIALDVTEVGDDCPVLIGRLPLEHLQLVVDVPNHRLAPSPANGGEWIMDMF